MAFSCLNSKGVRYYLNRKKVTLAKGGESVAYYFSKDERKETGISAIPPTKMVYEVPSSHMLLLKNIN